MLTRQKKLVSVLSATLVLLLTVVLVLFWWGVKLRQHRLDLTSHFVADIEFEYSSAQLYLSMADHLQRVEGRTSKAEEMYEKAIKSFERASAMVRAIQAVAFIEIQDYESAYEYCGEALEKWGSNMELVALHTMCARELGNDELLHKLKAKARHVLMGADDYHIQLMNSAFQEEVIQKKTIKVKDRSQQYFLEYLRKGGDMKPASPDSSKLQEQQ